MRGCMNALTAMVFLAIAGFVVLAIIGWIRDSGEGTAAEVERTGRILDAPVAVEIVEVF